MRWCERVLGLELTPRAWRAVLVEARLTGVRVIGTAAGPHTDATDVAASARAALETAAERLDVERGTRLGLAIGRPLAHLKRIELPEASRSSVRDALRTQAARLFPVGRQRVVTDYRRLRPNGQGTAANGAAIAAAAPEELVDGVADVAQTLGLDFVSADLAAGAARRLMPPEAELALLWHAPGLEWAAYDAAGRLVASRYVPTGPALPGPTALRPPDAIDWLPGRRVVVLGGDELAAALAESWPDVELQAGSAGRRGGPPELAGSELAVAYGAALQALSGRAGFDLRPERVQAKDSAAGRRRTLALLATAVAAVGLYWLAGFAALRSEVARLEREADLLAPQAERVVELRMTIAAAAELANALARLEADRPRWTFALVEMADALPPGAFLTSLRERGGRIRLEGYATDAAAVVEALEVAPALESVRLIGPVSRESTPLGDRERFSLEVVATATRGTP